MATTLKSQRRPNFCEFPAATGAPLCAKPATHAYTIKFGVRQKTRMVCDECAQYIERELWPGSQEPPERWDKVSRSVKEQIEARVKEGWGC
jgi:hypothetical protein